jgi:prepilin-type processing-associated H-X9-DG protein
MRSVATEEACKLHGDGSYIVFADGHVRFFTIDYYPKYADITAVRSWDAETQQWWNYGPGSGRSAPYLKSIAITP